MQVFYKDFLLDLKAVMDSVVRDTKSIFRASFWDSSDENYRANLGVAAQQSSFHDDACSPRHNSVESWTI